jgi:hypothetical protein
MLIRISARLQAARQAACLVEAQAYRKPSGLPASVPGIQPPQQQHGSLRNMTRPPWPLLSSSTSVDAVTPSPWGKPGGAGRGEARSPDIPSCSSSSWAGWRLGVRRKVLCYCAGHRDGATDAFCCPFRCPSQPVPARARFVELCCLIISPPCTAMRRRGG